MRRVHSRLSILAIVVALSALGLVAFGILTLEGAVTNAEAAAQNEARRASVAAVRELRARVLHPGFADRLPAEECVVVTATKVRPPSALPVAPHEPDPDFVTQATLELARQLEFEEQAPDQARAGVDLALARKDRSPTDRAHLLACLLWIARRQGDTETAEACRAALCQAKVLPAAAAATLLHYDSLVGRASEQRSIDTLLAKTDQDRYQALAYDLAASMRARGLEERARQLEEEQKRVQALRAALFAIEQASGRLRSRGEVVIEALGDDDSAGPAMGRVLLWYPSGVDRSASDAQRVAQGGKAWVLPLARFASLALQDRDSEGVTTFAGTLRLDSRVSTGDREDALPAFAGIHALPEARPRTESTVPTRVLLLALALLLLAGLWLLMRAFRAERVALCERGDFLRSITHELRTPLASIRLFAETLVSGRTKDERQRTEFTELLAAEAGRLSTLVENALELGRSERGERVWSFEDARLDEVVHESVALFAPLAREASLDVHVTTVPLTLRFDRDALRQVLWNLLDNAAKYAPEGKRIDVTLGLVAGRNTSDSGTCVLRVRDHGTGLDAGERERVFERFVRGRARSDGAIPGAGLGLAIVRSIVHAHGGAIRCETASDGPGACFVVTLPCRGVTDPRATQSNASQA